MPLRTEDINNFKFKSEVLHPYLFSFPWCRIVTHVAFYSPSSPITLKYDFLKGDLFNLRSILLKDETYNTFLLFLFFGHFIIHLPTNDLIYKDCISFHSFNCKPISSVEFNFHASKTKTALNKSFWRIFFDIHPEEQLTAIFWVTRFPVTWSGIIEYIPKSARPG